MMENNPDKKTAGNMSFDLPHRSETVKIENPMADPKAARLPDHSGPPVRSDTITVIPNRAIPIETQVTADTRSFKT